jgi:hypothetical protein
MLNHSTRKDEHMDVPFSAYALCYIPLAVTVLGLLALFFITDAHARRPYLRSNPFVAYTTPIEELEQRAPAIGETPAGPLGATPPGDTTVFEGEMGKLAPVTPEGVVEDPSLIDPMVGDPEAPQDSLAEGIGELPATPLNKPEDDDPNAPKPLGPGDKIV